MQFKHFLYWGSILCAVGQVLLALYARFYGEVAAQIQTAQLSAGDGEMAVIKALNYALPLSVGCIAMLLYTRKINQVGGVALAIAIAFQAMAMDLNLRAVRHVFGEDVKLETVAWWYPTEKTVATFSGG